MLFKGNSSKLELLIEKIQANKENGTGSGTGSVAHEEVSVGGSSWDVGSDGRGSLSPASSATPTSASETDVEAAATVGVTQTTPYQCSFCDRAFPRLSYLKRHEQLHGMWPAQGTWPWLPARRPLEHAFPSTPDSSSPSLDKCMEEFGRRRRDEILADVLKTPEKRTEPRPFPQGVFAPSRYGMEGVASLVVPRGTDSHNKCLDLSPCETDQANYYRGDPVCELRGLLRENQWSSVCSESSGPQSPHMYKDEVFSFHPKDFQEGGNEDTRTKPHNRALLDGWLAREVSRACSPPNIWMQENVVSYIERELKELEDQHPAEGVVECTSRAISDEFFRYIQMELRRLDSGVDLEGTPPSARHAFSPFEVFRTPEERLPTRLHIARCTSPLPSEDGSEGDIAQDFGRGDETISEQSLGTSLGCWKKPQANLTPQERLEKVWKPVLCLRHLDQLPTSLCHYSQTLAVKPGLAISHLSPLRKTYVTSSETTCASQTNTRENMSDKLVPKKNFKAARARSNSSVAAQRQLRHLRREKAKGKKRREKKGGGLKVFQKGLGELQFDSSRKFQQPSEDLNQRYEQLDQDSASTKAQTNSLSVQIPLSRICLRKNLGNRSESQKPMISEPDRVASLTDCLKSSPVPSGMQLTPESEERSLGTSPSSSHTKLFPMSYASFTCPVTRMFPGQPVQVVETSHHLPHTPLSIRGEHEEATEEAQTGLYKSISLVPYPSEERGNMNHYVHCVQPYSINIHSPYQSLSFPQMSQELRTGDLPCQTLCGVPFHTLLPWQHHVTPTHTLPAFQDVQGLCIPFLDLSGHPSPDVVVKDHSHFMNLPGVCSPHTSCPQVQKGKAKYCSKSLKWRQRDLGPGCSRLPFFIETNLHYRERDVCKNEESEFPGEGDHWSQAVTGPRPADTRTRGENKRPTMLQPDHLNTALHIQVRTGALAEQRGKSRAILSKLDQKQRTASRVIQVRTQERSRRQSESGKVIEMPSKEAIEQDSIWGRDTNISILQIPKVMPNQDSIILDEGGNSNVTKSGLFFEGSVDSNSFLQHTTPNSCPLTEDGCIEKEKCSLRHIPCKSIDTDRPCEKSSNKTESADSGKYNWNDDLHNNTNKRTCNFPLSSVMPTVGSASGWKRQKCHPYILPKKRHKNMFHSVDKVDGGKYSRSCEEAVVSVEESLHKCIDDISKTRKDFESSDEENVSPLTNKTDELLLSSQTGKSRSDNSITAIEEHLETHQKRGNNLREMTNRASPPSKAEVSSDCRELPEPSVCAEAEVKRFVLEERQSSYRLGTNAASQSLHHQQEPMADPYCNQVVNGNLQGFDSMRKEGDTSTVPHPLPPAVVSPSSIVRQGAHFGLIRKIAPCLLRPVPCKALSRKGSLMNRYLANRKRQMSFLNRRVSPTKMKEMKLGFGTAVTNSLNGKDDLIEIAPLPKDSQSPNSPSQDGKERVTIYSPSGRAENALIDCEYFAQNLCDSNIPKEENLGNLPASNADLDADLSAVTSSPEQSPDCNDHLQQVADKCSESDDDHEREMAQATEFGPVLRNSSQEKNYSFSEDKSASSDMPGLDQVTSANTSYYHGGLSNEAMPQIIPTNPTFIPALSSKTKQELETSKSESIQEPRLRTLEDMKEMNHSPMTMASDSAVKIRNTDWGEESIMCITGGHCIDEWPIMKKSVTSQKKYISSSGSEEQDHETSLDEGLQFPNDMRTCLLLEESASREPYQGKEMQDHPGLRNSVITLERLRSCKLYVDTPLPPSPQQLGVSSNHLDRPNLLQHVTGKSLNASVALCEEVEWEKGVVDVLRDCEAEKDRQRDLDLLDLLTAESSVASSWPTTDMAVRDAFLRVEGDSYPTLPNNPNSLGHKEGCSPPLACSSEGKLPQAGVGALTAGWDVRRGDEGTKNQPCLLACGSPWALKQQDALSSSSSCSSGSSVAGEYEEEAEVLLEARRDEVGGEGGSGADGDRGEAKEGSERRKRRRGKNSSSYFIDVVTHADQLPFRCEFCGRLFKHKRSRDRHVKLHTGDKKYKCCHCEAAFSRSDHLKIHMKTHDTQKPYQCSVCNRGYNTAAALTAHMQNHKAKLTAHALSQLLKDAQAPSDAHTLTQLLKDTAVGDTHAQALNHFLKDAQKLLSPKSQQGDLGAGSSPGALRASPGAGEASPALSPVAAARCPVCHAHCRNHTHLQRHLTRYHGDDVPMASSDRPASRGGGSGASSVGGASSAASTPSPRPPSSLPSPRPLANPLLSLVGGKLACLYCSRDAFPSLEALQLHLHSSHGSVLNGEMRDMASMLGLPTSLGGSLGGSLGAGGLAASLASPLGPGSSRGVSCELCGARVGGVTALQRHVVTAHTFTDLLARAAEGVFCAQCLLPFSNPGALAEHIKLVHAAPVLSAVLNKRPPSPPTDTPTDLSKKSRHEGLPSDLPASTLLCSQCNAPFTNFEAFRRHLKTHLEGVEAAATAGGGAAGMACPECRLPLSSEAGLEAHLATHLGATATEYGCQACLKLFPKPDELQKHLMDIHAHHLYRCALCKEMFDSKVSIQVHFAVKHSNECKVHKCTRCSLIFRSQSEFEVHIRASHMRRGLGVGEAGPGAGSLGGPGGSYRCLLCTLSLSSEAELAAHVATHQRQFQCTLCDDAFHVEFLLDKHMQTQHNSELNGNVPQPENLAKPRRSPHKKELKCDICDAEFSSDSGLLAHRKQAHNIKSGAGGAGAKVAAASLSLFCAYCSEACKSRSDLEAHMKSHQGSGGRHKCNICDELCPSAALLAQHKLTHVKVVSGSACAVCREPLTSEQQFSSHQSEHHPAPLPQPCVVCRQTLVTDMEVSVHARFHAAQAAQAAAAASVASSGPFSSSDPVQPVSLASMITTTASSAAATASSNSSSSRGSSSPRQSPSLRCPECHLKLETMEEAEAHAAVHQQQQQQGYGRSVAPSSRTYQCIKCQESFASEAEIEAHVASHLLHEGSVHECHLCRATFDTPLRLQCHLIEHTFEGCGSFTCYMCSSVFTTASRLQQHMVEHGLSARPYDCHHCHQRFFFRAELENHVLSHPEAAEGSCRECVASFPELPRRSHRRPALSALGPAQHLLAGHAGHTRPASPCSACDGDTADGAAASANGLSASSNDAKEM
ncbi:uncharacterized protein LOC119582906 isoform X2 [Penaeus monodon]|uniref:uncharacterized protein LOC119582906 isoform X2 n=1 Tax=Penaeus monodon TaxID=6687 RepID=UPI0018A79762|nr:uncharacterized protein LOC119582906 isoform X2 [Penaeus monodon]